MKNMTMNPSVDPELYVGDDGSTIRREYGPTKGTWVYRDAAGQYLDQSDYRVDLAARYELELVGDV